MTSSERRKIFCSVTFHVIAITCVVWSLYVLIDRTAEEIRQGNDNGKCTFFLSLLDSATVPRAGRESHCSGAGLRVWCPSKNNYQQLSLPQLRYGLLIGSCTGSQAEMGDGQVHVNLSRKKSINVIHHSRLFGSRRRIRFSFSLLTQSCFSENMNKVKVQ